MATAPPPTPRDGCPHTRHRWARSFTTGAPAAARRSRYWHPHCATTSARVPASIAVPDRTEANAVRARNSDTDVVEHLGIKIHYEVHGDGQPTILLTPTCTDRAQAVLEGAAGLPGASPPAGDLRRPWQRPLRPAARPRRMRPVGAGRLRTRRAGRHRHRPAVVVGLSRAGNWALQLAAEHADRVLGTMLIGAGVALAPTAGPSPSWSSSPTASAGRPPLGSPDPFDVHRVGRSVIHFESCHGRQPPGSIRSAKPSRRRARPNS